MFIDAQTAKDDAERAKIHAVLEFIAMKNKKWYWIKKRVLSLLFFCHSDYCFGNTNAYYCILGLVRQSESIAYILSNKNRQTRKTFHIIQVSHHGT